MLRSFREQEQIVRVWIQFHRDGAEAYGSARATNPARVSARTAANSSPSPFRTQLLELDCMLREIGKPRATVLVKRCTRRRKSADASFEQIASETHGLTTEAARMLYSEAVSLFFLQLVAANFSETPYEPARKLGSVPRCAARENGAECAIG